MAMMGVRSGAIRSGMWCIDEEGRVGIASFSAVRSEDGLAVYSPGATRPDETEAFHLVRDNGTTKLEVVRPWAGLVQAALEDIPEARRPTARAAEALGYRSKGKKT